MARFYKQDNDNRSLVGFIADYSFSLVSFFQHTYNRDGN